MAKRRAPSLRRRRPRREPKKRFIIFCEGANTEPSYFKALRSVCANALIAIEAVPGVGVPYTIAKKAVAFAEGFENSRKLRRTSSFEEGDEVWAAFDRDQHPKFKEAIDLCTRKRIGIARSNPCFEIWLILHIEDFNRPDDRAAVMARLHKLRPEYDPRASKTPNYGSLFEFLEDAEKRADILLKRRIEEQNPYGRPSTTVGALTKAIRTAAEKSVA